jgi:hypothetical protein
MKTTARKITKIIEPQTVVEGAGVGPKAWRDFSSG